MASDQRSTGATIEPGHVHPDPGHGQSKPRAAPPITLPPVTPRFGEPPNRLLAPRAALIVAIGALLFALLGTALVWLLGSRANDALTARTTELLVADVRALSLAYKMGGVPAVRDVLTDPELGARAVLYDQHGTIIAGALALDAPSRAQLARGGLVEAPGNGAKPRAVYVGRAAIVAKDEHTLLVVRNVADQITLIDQLRWWLFAGLSCLGLAALFGIMMARRTQSARIARVAATSQSILAGNFSTRLPRDYSEDEFDGLVRDVNVMLGRIEELMATVRDVSDNIAHDLRTPINRLRNSAEAALRAGDGAANGAGGHAAALEQVIVEADEIIRMFNALLEISRLKGSGVSDTFEAVDLSQLCIDIAEFYAPLAELQAFTIETAIAPGLSVRGNPRLLGQVLSNLIENALKYGVPADGAGSPRRIDIALTTTPGNTLRIDVRDRGRGIPPQERERVLERFVRLEASRSLPGTGLGLSLVAAIVRLHQGQLVLGDNAPGLLVSVHLPRS